MLSWGRRFSFCEEIGWSNLYKKEWILDLEKDCFIFGKGNILCSLPHRNPIGRIAPSTKDYFQQNQLVQSDELWGRNVLSAWNILRLLKNCLKISLLKKVFLDLVLPKKEGVLFLRQMMMVPFGHKIEDSHLVLVHRVNPFNGKFLI